MIEFHDPRGEVAVEAEPYTLAFDVAANGGEGVTIGLLANGFPDSENFLNHIGAALKGLLPNVSTKSWNKGNASIAASDEMLSEIQQSCQVAVAAYGH
jgi:hypothetical protein